jgi:pyridoxine/pyridoxamine 5'-phosphate oxidase
MKGLHGLRLTLRRPSAMTLATCHIFGPPAQRTKKLQERQQVFTHATAHTASRGKTSEPHPTQAGARS